MGEENFCFQMAIFMKAIFVKAKNMAKGLTDGKTAMFTMEGSCGIKEKELGCIDGVMVLFTEDSGERAKCMGLAG